MSCNQKVTKYKKMPLKLSVYLRYLHHDKKLTIADLVKRYPEYPRVTIRTHAKKDINVVKPDGRLGNKNAGRKKKLSDRDVRRLETSLHKLRTEHGNFHSTDIEEDAGFKFENVSNRTIRRALNNKGYDFTQCRKKGQLSLEDEKKRIAFARKCKKLPSDFWTSGISFYLDGTGWVHKTNPCKTVRTTRTRTWKKKGESLSKECLSKGKKEGVGGKVAKFMVAIAHGRGVIKCLLYKKLNGEMCANFIRNHFPAMFADSPNPRGKLFLQDGDPSQNSKVSKVAMDSIGCRLFHIPARSPDLNPIENVFHNIGKILRQDALTNRIEKETFKQFAERAQRICLSYSSDIIDKTIESMPRRINMVIQNKGQRTKY